MNAMTPQSQRMNPNIPRAEVAPLPRARRDQVCIVGAPGASIVDYEGLCEVITPEPEYRPSKDKRKQGAEFLSYKPVPFPMFADAVRDAFTAALGAGPTSESYSLAANGQQMYGIMAFRDAALEASGNGIAVAMRSSHNKSLLSALATGTDCFVCANHSFPRGAQVGHKHSSQTLQKLPGIIDAQAKMARKATKELVEAMDSLRGIPCSDYRFAAYLGILQWEGYINDTLANRARRYWRASTAGGLHDDHGNRDLFGALQAVTGGLGGRVAPSGAFRAYGGALHVVQTIAANGGDTNVVIPALPELALA